MEEYYMEYEEITFNDIPRAMANILRKCDLLEQSIDVLREEIRQTNKPSTSQHIPMDVKEACDFSNQEIHHVPVYPKWSDSCQQERQEIHFLQR